MSKFITQFVCQECGASHHKWTGKCDGCGTWNSLIEEVVLKGGAGQSGQEGHANADLLDFVGITTENIHEQQQKNRKLTRISELDRVLGGGFVDSSVVLLGGPPGIGKSTLLLQILNSLDPNCDTKNLVYISAEESVNQVLLRANRLGIDRDDIKIATSSSIEQIASTISKYKNDAIVIVDSIQTISTKLIQSTVGSVSQVRYCTQELANIAKCNNIIVIIVTHITKDGMIAGPKTLEHMVDCVLYFEGDKALHNYRLLRCVKNRYGPTDEIGILTMTETGLHEVRDPSSIFLSGNKDNNVGMAIFSGIEGTRSILFEIQALVSFTNSPIPRRSSVGFDANRMVMLLAVLATKCKLNLNNKDVYVNVAGGMKVTESSADMSILAAIVSAALNRPIPSGWLFFGEISLSGSIRKAHMSHQRIKEAQKLGFTDVFVAHNTDDLDQCDTIRIHRLKTIRDLIAVIKESQG